MVKSRVNDLRRLLSQSLGKIEVVEEKTSLLTAPGEHYGSIMLALDVTIKDERGVEKVLNLVAKLIPANEMLRLAFDIPVTFKKEVRAYTEAIPAMAALQLEYGVPQERSIRHLFPKCYGARISLDENKNEVDEDGVILFENLKIQGFRTEDRLKGFDLAATKIIIKDLAQFHAIPIALKFLKPEVFKEKVLPCLCHNKGLEQLPPDVGKAFHEAIMDGAKEVEELKPFLKRVQEICDDALANPYVNRSPPNEPWGTMSHSDFWTSNTMILKDQNGNALRNKIVDLQLMRYASAPRDLVFFLFTSVINSVLDEHIDEFIRLYHESLVDNLKDFHLDMEQFSWDNFLKELDEVAPTEVYHVLVMLKPICTERGKVQNSAEDFQNSDWSRKDLLGPHHRNKLRETVLALHRKNWL